MSDEKNQTGATDETSTAATSAAAAAEAAATAAPETPAIDPLDVLKAENLELKEKYLRLAADMDNLRKRTEREKTDVAKYAISDFARDIIPLSDNFQRAISAVSPEAAERDEALRSFLDGIELTERELQKVLERYGVVKLDPKGEKADPNLHQVVQQIDNPNLPHNTICEVYQVGYMIADRVLRTAMVAVSRGGPKEVAASPAAAETTAEPDPSAAEPSVEPGRAGDAGAHVDKSV